MLTYIKSTIWDFVLCVVASTSLAYTVCSGFYATQPYQDAAGIAIMAGICIVVTAALFAASWSTRTIVFGSIAIAVCLIGVVIASVATSTTSTALEDAPGNNLFFSLSVLIPPVVVFVLSRRKASAVALIVVGVLLCAVIEYLYWYGHIGAFIVFFASSTALFVYRTYQASLINSESERFAFNSVTAAGVALALVSILLGAGVFMLVITPLSPPHLVVKLLTEHYRTEDHEVKGTSNTQSVLDPELFSNTLSNQVVETSSINSDQANKQTNDTTDQNDSNAQDVTGTSVSMGNVDQKDEEDGGLQFDPPWLPYVIAPLILLLLIVAAILVKRLLRARRFRAMTSGSNAQSVRSLYLFFLERFGRFKIPQPQTLTLSEYASGFASTFSDFERKAPSPTFPELTAVYSENVYGGVEPDDTALSKFEDYYHTFYKKARGYVGKLKYCLMYFFI